MGEAWASGTVPKPARDVGARSPANHRERIDSAARTSRASSVGLCRMPLLSLYCSSIVPLLLIVSLPLAQLELAYVWILILSAAF